MLENVGKVANRQLGKTRFCSSFLFFFFSQASATTTAAISMKQAPLCRDYSQLLHLLIGFQRNKTCLTVFFGCLKYSDWTPFCYRFNKNCKPRCEQLSVYQTAQIHKNEHKQVIKRFHTNHKDVGMSVVNKLREQVWNPLQHPIHCHT